MNREKRFPGLILKLIDLVLSEDKNDSRMESMIKNGAAVKPDENVLV